MSEFTADLNPDHVLFLTSWAAKHGATVTFNGTCGFGRECVGVLIGGQYLDYSHLWDLGGPNDNATWERLWWAPEDAYHKHGYMAVLGLGPEAVEQLYEWAKFLDEHGWTVAEQSRRPDHALDALLHGFSTPMLMPPAEAPEPEPESLIAAVERLGHAVEHGADRGAAIRELCDARQGGLTPVGAGDLLDDWRNVRRRYDALAGATRSQLDALWAVVQASRAREGGE